MEPAGVLIAGRFRLEHRLGEGGMAEVWSAQDTSLGREVAVKLMHPQMARSEDGRFAERFHRECRVTAGLQHANVPVVYDAGEHDGQLYLVMQRIVGPTLEEFMLSHHPLPLTAVAAVGAQICSALAAAHDAGLVHRDLKPANVMMAGTGVLMVMDFGVVAVNAPDTTRLTATGHTVGTAAYMAPEQAAFGTADARTDLYALGCILFELLAGEPVFGAAMPAPMMQCHISEAPRHIGDLRAGIPPELCGLVSGLLEKETRRRPPSARDVFEQLRPHLPGPGDELAIPAPQPDPTLPFRAPCAPPPAADPASQKDRPRPRRRRSVTPPSRDALRGAGEKAVELAERGFLLEAVRLLTDILQPAVPYYGARDDLIVRMRVARANLLLEAGEHAQARDAFIQVRPGAAYLQGEEADLVAHIDDGLADCAGPG